jgi:hypothetical protein
MMIATTHTAPSNTQCPTAWQLMSQRVDGTGFAFGSTILARSLAG